MTDHADPVWERPGLADREGPLTEWQAAARRYRIDFGCSAWVLGRAVWTVTGDIEALEVPVQLGRRGLDLLVGSGVVPSVFTTSDRWVFLVVHHDHTRWQWAPRLAALGVEHRWAGAMLDLPPTRRDEDRCEWVTSLVLPLPELSVVAEAITRAAVAGPGR